VVSSRSGEALEKRFRSFREDVSKFSNQTISDFRIARDPSRSVRKNVGVTKAIFGKWGIEILVAIYTLKALRFEELRKILRPISSRVLSEKVKLLEDAGLVNRSILDTHPPRAQYSLTEKGLTVATLGEPVLLYLRLKEGLL
jgi:DNA-binding HxlR family transcriptional regulator